MRFEGSVTAKSDFKKFPKANARYNKNISDALKRTTLQIHASAIKSIQKSSGGTRATRYNPKRTVTVSRPGNAPNTDTGRLAQSVGFEIRKGKTSSVGVVGTNLKYGAWLEFGTRMMGARPWLRPAFKKLRNKTKEMFKVLLPIKGEL